MFKGFYSIIIALSVLWISASVLDAGISQTATFTLSVTIPEHSQLPAATLIGPQKSELSFREDRQLHLQKDFRDDQVVYLASYVVN